jgi:CO/xanthine dehydrogenase Mo-binding subunit
MRHSGTSPFGAPVTPLDGPDKITGVARYTFDTSLPGMLHARNLAQPLSGRQNSPEAGIASPILTTGVGRAAGAD